MEQRNERVSARQSTDTRDARYAFAPPETPATKRAGGEPHAVLVTTSDPVERPLSMLLFLFMWPFWLFRDATRGDRLTRAAAYRHNRAMRVHLPGYLFRWSVGAVLVFALMAVAESLGGLGAPPSLLMLLAAALGVAFAGSLCVLFVTAYIYLYLSRNDEAH